jgi:hypothetical protein
VSAPADERAAPRARILRALTIAFMLLALARLTAIVVHDPLAGYANQYDMVRTAACIGLWPAGDPAARALATPDAPRPAQVFDAPQPDGCYPSTDVALAWIGATAARALGALGFDGVPGIDLRAIGATKAALFALLLLAATRVLRAHPRVACAHAAFVAFVICDPLNTLYLNTLYTETGALLGAWLAVLGLLMRTLPRTDHRLAFAAVLLGAALLGASRVQHLALPFGFAMLWWIAARANRASTLAAPSTLARNEPLPLDGRGGESRRMRRPAERPREERGPDGGAGERVPTSPKSPPTPAVANNPAIPSPREAGRGAGVRGALAQTFTLLLIALAAVTLQLTTQTRFESIAGANRQNMLFGALLPAADDPAHLATRLGLPPHCADLAYASWYRQLGRDIASACPEATQPSLARIAWVVATEPATALTLAGRSLVQSTAWRMPYVGEIAGGSFQRLGPGPLGLTASLTDAAATSSLAAHALFWLLPLLAAFGSSWRLLRAPPRPAMQIALDAGLAACAGIVATVWATSILGDGYSELARHLHLAVSAVCAGWLLLGIALWHARPRAALESVATLAIALAIIAAGARAPLAVGRLEPPATDAILAGQVPLSGWLLAPRGATAVELREAGTVVARFDIQPSPQLAALFPIADGATARRFEGTLDAGAPRPRTLELFVIAPDGSVQRIDRRRFDLAP